jgi:hypothetical protein
MQRLKCFIVWLRRFRHSSGFGIQSPSDYWLTRYVINEHWPYYHYELLGKGDGKLQQKLGRLFFRLANWRQPRFVISDGWHDYLQAGCQQAHVISWHDCGYDIPDMVVLPMGDDSRERLTHIYTKVNEQSVLVVENIQNDKNLWRDIISDERTGVTFDLYYCGLVFFDKKRTKQHYIINF